MAYTSSRKQNVRWAEQGRPSASEWHHGSWWHLMLIYFMILLNASDVNTGDPPTFVILSQCFSITKIYDSAKKCFHFHVHQILDSITAKSMNAPKCKL